MAIVEDKKRKTYYITYHYISPDGSRKTANIRNARWKVSVGKRYMKSIEAAEIAKDEASRKNAGRSPEEAGMTMGSLSSKYIREQSLRCKKQTAYGKQKAIAKHIFSYISPETKVAKAMTAETVLRLRERISAEGLAPRTFNHVMHEIRELIAFSADLGAISYESSERLRRMLKSVSQQKEVGDARGFWTPDEYEAFRRTFDEDDAKWGTFFDVAYWGALRIGEILGLKWKRVDFSRGTIFVCETLGRSGEPQSTKNSSSNAPVSLPMPIIDELSKLKESLFAGDDEYVFFGTHTSRTTARRVMEKHIAEAKVPHIRIHDLRHSMASRLINTGVNPLVVSKHLRHSSTQQTLDTYSHLFPNITEGLMDRVYDSGCQIREQIPAKTENGGNDAE